MDVEPLWSLYRDGKITQALAAAGRALRQDPDDTAAKELRALSAWCYYRRKMYDLALQWIDGAGDHPRAIACHVYILAYAKEYANDKKLWSLIAQLDLRENIDAGNAAIIRARAQEATVTHEQVWYMAKTFAEPASTAERNVSVANLLHNTGRFFLDKARDRRDLCTAVGFLELALAHYGETTNWHHRAAASFWLSQAFERLTAIPQAFRFAVASLELWRAQCELESDTAPFKDKLDNAVARVHQMATMLGLFALKSKEV